jgi:hypothetical protein
VVELTRRQAQAFRDKFDPVDGSEWRVLPHGYVYTPESSGVESVPGESPAIPVRAHSHRDPNAPPADPSALEPNRQGQPSREQRNLQDGASPSRGASAPAGPQTPPSPRSGGHVATAPASSEGKPAPEIKKK